MPPPPAGDPDRARLRQLGYKQELKRNFRPEFLNRIDEIIVFEPLTKENVLQIVDIMLRRLNKHLESQKVSIEVTDAAKEFLAEQGYAYRIVDAEDVSTL